MLKKSFWITLCIGVLLLIVSIILILMSVRSFSAGLILLAVLIIIVDAIVTPITLVNMYGKAKEIKKREDEMAEKQKEISRYELLISKEGFKSSKTIHFNKIHFAVDTDNKLINFTSQNENRTFGFSDLVSYELIEDGQTVTSSSTANAVAGGLLFGATGAIVGSTMKKNMNLCAKMQLRISINDIANPSIVQDLIVPPGVDKNRAYYTEAFNYAKEVCATLAVIQKQIA